MRRAPELGLGTDPVIVASARLAEAGCESPRLDAELLLAEVLGTTRTALYLTPPRALEPTARARFEELIARRAEREPVAYILGRKPFRRLEVPVDRRVLIPRPETELLVEVGLELPARARVADVGTGSGAVALALADERPDLAVTGIDASADALVLARDNARRLGLEVSFLRDDEDLPPEVGRYEPAEALYGGPDGLEVIGRLVSMAAQTVPILALEVGAGQATAVALALRDAGFDDVERRRDLAGHERVVVGRR
jgi:release factor glutamine methyltransferase